MKTKKTELLFLALILRMLKKGGRSATIVPDGVLFGSSQGPRRRCAQLLVKDNQLEAVISLPIGRVQALRGRVDGHSRVHQGRQDGPRVLLRRRAPTASRSTTSATRSSENDLPDALERWRKRNAKKDTDRTAKHFMVPVKEIEAKDFDLSINRYKEAKHEAVEYDPPKKIIAKLRALEAEIAKDLSELEAML